MIDALYLQTMSATEPKKAKPVSLPPMQVTPLPPSSAHRVATLKTSNSSLNSINSGGSRTSTISRATSQTASSLQKHSDTSLRRHQLPTIAGSPSVGTITSREQKEGHPSTLNHSASAASKETPTKIPRIASRSSTVTSPTTLKSRRTSVMGGNSADPSPIQAETMNEFGVLENLSSTKLPTTSRHSFRTSPSTSASRVPRQLSTQTSAAGSIRKPNRESMSFAGMRKTSTGSVASMSTATQDTPSTSRHRFSALSPSKGLKLLSPKVSLSAARTSNSSSSSQSNRQSMASPSLSQQSFSTPSPPPNQVDEDELIGDEEMLHYIKRQQAKKLAHGATQEELDEMLCFPEPLPPVPPTTPAGELQYAGIREFN